MVLIMACVESWWYGVFIVDIQTYHFVSQTLIGSLFVCLFVCGDLGINT